MRFAVGSALIIKGAAYLCTRISRIKEVRVMDIDAETMRKDCTNTSATIHQNVSIADFKTGEICTTEIERILLECAGREAISIYTKYQITKGDNEDARSNTEGSGGADQQPAITPPEGPWDGVQDGEGTGTTSPSPASNPVHGDGSGGEGGAVVHAREG